MREKHEVATENGVAMLPWIIAVDFDGTIVENRFPEIGMVKRETVRQLKLAKEQGCALILWTCRTGKALREAIQLTDSEGIQFDAINDNLDEVKALGWEARKVYANEYWDDKAIEYFCDNMTSKVVENEPWKR